MTKQFVAKQRFKVHGSTIEGIGTLRDYDVANYNEQYITISYKSGITQVELIEEERYGKTHPVTELEYVIYVPFLKHPVLLDVHSVRKEEHYRRNFELHCGHNTLTQNQAEWLLIFFKELFVSRRPQDTKELLRNMLRNTQPSGGKLNTVI